VLRYVVKVKEKKIGADPERNKRQRMEGLGMVLYRPEEAKGSFQEGL